MPSLDRMVVPVGHDIASGGEWLTTWEPAVVWLAEANSTQTRRAYLATVRGLAGLAQVQLGEVREVHVAGFKATLVDRELSPATIRQRLIILRLFFAWCIARGHHPGPNPAGGISLPGKQRTSPGIALSLDQLEELVAACARPRDRAIVALLAGSGLRGTEAANLRERDYTTDAGEKILIVRNGKGGITRKVSLPGWAADLLEAYLAGRTRDPAGPLLQRLGRGGQADRSSAGISYHTVYRTVVETAQAAGLPEISPHDLRRTFATAALDAGVPLPALQREMGHTDPRQTIDYYVPGREAGTTTRVADYVNW